MKRLFVLAATAIMLGAFVTAASAQGGGGRGQGRGQGRGGFGGGGLNLLRIAEVQTELKMTQPQIEKVNTKSQEVGQAMRELFQGGGGGAPPDPAELQKNMAKMQEINSKAVADILDTTQMKRFKQLELQQAMQQGGGGGFGGGFGRPGGGGGAGAPGGGQNLGVYGRKEVADALNLTEKQKADISKINQDAAQAMRDAMQGFDFQNASQEERQAAFAKMAEARTKSQKESSDKINAILTDAQKGALKGLLGEPFKFPPPQQRRPQNPPIA